MYENRDQQSYRPDVIAAIADMEEGRRLIPDSPDRHILAIQVASEQMQLENVNSFGQFEDHLRIAGSDTHLVAVPVDQCDPRLVVGYPAPREDGSQPQYIAHPTNKFDAFRWNAHFGVSPEENRNRLEEAGLVTGHVETGWLDRL